MSILLRVNLERSALSRFDWFDRLRTGEVETSAEYVFPAEVLMKRACLRS
ncbi:MAG: hypothetical protein WC853_14700 [Thermodesulfovibrionales bacterium]